MRARAEWKLIIIIMIKRNNKIDDFALDCRFNGAECKDEKLTIADLRERERERERRKRGQRERGERKRGKREREEGSKENERERERERERRK